MAAPGMVSYAQINPVVKEIDPETLEAAMALLRLRYSGSIPPWALQGSRNDSVAGCPEGSGPQEVTPPQTTTSETKTTKRRTRRSNSDAERPAAPSADGPSQPKNSAPTSRKRRQTPAMPKAKTRAETKAEEAGQEKGKTEAKPQVRPQVKPQVKTAKALRRSEQAREKKFRCEYCNKRFSRNEHANRHTQSLHFRLVEARCSECGKLFSRRDNAGTHTARCPRTRRPARLLLLPRVAPSRPAAAGASVSGPGQEGAQDGDVDPSPESKKSSGGTTDEKEVDGAGADDSLAQDPMKGAEEHQGPCYPSTQFQPINRPQGVTSLVVQ